MNNKISEFARFGNVSHTDEFTTPFNADADELPAPDSIQYLSHQASFAEQAMLYRKCRRRQLENQSAEYARDHRFTLFRDFIRLMHRHGMPLQNLRNIVAKEEKFGSTLTEAIIYNEYIKTSEYDTQFLRASLVRQIQLLCLLDDRIVLKVAGDDRHLVRYDYSKGTSSPAGASFIAKVGEDLASRGILLDGAEIERVLRCIAEEKNYFLN